MITIVVPMAGRGSRFAGTAEPLPKPLIEVLPGRRMIDYVVRYLTLDEPHRFVFVCLGEHDRRFDFAHTLAPQAGGIELALTETVTRGPAASALLAERFMDDGELLIAYSDNYLTTDMAAYLEHVRARGADGAVVVYPSQGAMESYVTIDTAGCVLRAAEKEVISLTATAGLYYFRRGRDFADAARRMIAREDAREREFFVCPVYNELIADGKLVVAYPIQRGEKIEMGSPEDLAEARRRLDGMEIAWA